MMGNEAIARGAIEAGVDFTASYPGSPSSEIQEALAQASKIFGQPVVAENKPGGNSYLAFVTTMDSRPDGYTLCETGSLKYDCSVMFDKVPRKVEDGGRRRRAGPACPKGPTFFVSPPYRRSISTSWANSRIGPSCASTC
jgi:hypothetical protein